MKKKSTSFLHFLRPTIGKLLVILMAAYFIFTFISIRDRVEINYYEVEEGSLENHQDYTGLIIRSEEPVYAKEAGNIYFYVADGRKVASNNPVYAIDTDGTLTDYLDSHADELSYIDDENAQDLRSDLISFSRTLKNTDFSAFYDNVSLIRQDAVEYANLGVFSNLTESINEQEFNIKSYSSDKSGTVCFYTDGYEDVDLSSLRAELLDRSSYQKGMVNAGDLVSTDTAVYKLIDGEDWKIAFILSKEDEEMLKDSSSLTVYFTDKGFSTRCDFSLIYGTDGTCFGVFDLDSYMVQFTAERFVNLEIVTNNIQGLKIPDKSITTKDFYIIPSEYLSYDARGNAGFYVLTQNGDTETSQEFVQTDVYSEENGYCYIEIDDGGEIANGTKVVMEDSSSGYIVGEKGSLTGVYNINKGYTLFRRIEPPNGQDELLSSNGYTIVAKNTSYGLSTYDHIVLDASSVDDDQLLYR